MQKNSSTPIEILQNAFKNPEISEPNDIQKRIRSCIRQTTIKTEMGEKTHYYLEMTKDIQKIILHHENEIHTFFGKQPDDNPYYYLESFAYIPNHIHDPNFSGNIASFETAHIKQFDQKTMNHRKEMIKELKLHQSDKSFLFSTPLLDRNELDQQKASVWKQFKSYVSRHKMMLLGIAIIATLALTLLNPSFAPMTLPIMIICIAIFIAYTLIEPNHINLLKSKGFAKPSKTQASPLKHTKRTINPQQDYHHSDKGPNISISPRNK